MKVAAPVAASVMVPARIRAPWAAPSGPSSSATFPPTRFTDRLPFARRPPGPGRDPTTDMPPMMLTSPIVP